MARLLSMLAPHHRLGLSSGFASSEVSALSPGPSTQTSCAACVHVSLPQQCEVSKDSIWLVVNTGAGQGWLIRLGACVLRH